MSVEHFTSRVKCDGTIVCGATIDVDVDEGGYTPSNGAMQCSSCAADLCASHAVGAKDGVCFDCLEREAPLTPDEAFAISRAIVELGKAPHLVLMERAAWLGLMKCCPHPEASRAVFAGPRRDECGICGIGIGPEPAKAGAA